MNKEISEKILKAILENRIIKEIHIKEDKVTITVEPEIYEWSPDYSPSTTLTDDISEGKSITGGSEQ